MLETTTTSNTRHATGATATACETGAGARAAADTERPKAGNVPTEGARVPNPDSAGQTLTSDAHPSTIERLALVIVTYKRHELLADLFDSILALEDAPWRVVLVDNEDSPEVAIMAQGLDRRLSVRWGEPEPDARGDRTWVAYAPQAENVGGAGGFSAGVSLAFSLGAQWFWLMDDDVLVEPAAIRRLARWTDRYQVVQGARRDFDGGAFFWQYRFILPLGIPNPLATPDLGPEGFRPMNQLCFEGGLFSREVVRKIGLPDPRFFIYGDDACYGYLASKVTDAVAVSDVILRRSRSVSNWEINRVRQLNSTSDTNRYFIMRNRGYTAHYMREHGDYNRVLYGMGTAATFAKELIRLVAVDRTFRTGVTALIHGMRDARKIYRDRSWKPMPPVDDQP